MKKSLFVDLPAMNTANRWPQYPPGIACEYKPGQVVQFLETHDEEGEFAVVLGHIDPVCEELRTDLAGMVCFSDIKPATENDKTLILSRIQKFLK